MGNCDVCKLFGLSHLFLNGEQAEIEHRKVEKFKRAVEYGTLYSG